jgi:hypothetical protein
MSYPVKRCSHALRPERKQNKTNRTKAIIRAPLHHITMKLRSLSSARPSARPTRALVSQVTTVKRRVSASNFKTTIREC